MTFYPGVYLWRNNIEIGDNIDIGIGTFRLSQTSNEVTSIAVAKETTLEKERFD